MQTLQYTPGQVVTVFLETKNSSGVRANASSLPSVLKITNPDLTFIANFPKPMINLSTGIYYFKFNLPVGSAAVGSYLVDISYTDPATSNPSTAIFQVIVSAQFGNFGTTSS